MLRSAPKVRESGHLTSAVLMYRDQPLHTEEFEEYSRVSLVLDACLGARSRMIAVCAL